MENTAPRPHYRAIVLAISCLHRPEYRALDQIQKSYANRFPQIRNLYVYGAHAPEFEATFAQDDLYFPDIREGYRPWMLHKTYRALRHIHDAYDYDYIVRTNTSTFWRYPQLLERLDTLPSTGCLAGSESQVIRPPQLHGVGMVMSADVVEQLLEIPDIVQARAMEDSEDKMFTRIIEENLKIQRTVQSRLHYVCNLKSYDEQRILEHIRTGEARGCDHYRVNNWAQDRTRILDQNVLKYLIRHYYGISPVADADTRNPAAPAQPGQDTHATD